MTNLLFHPHSVYLFVTGMVSLLISIPSTCLAADKLQASFTTELIFLFSCLGLLIVILALALYRSNQHHNQLNKQYAALSQTHQAMLEQKHYWEQLEKILTEQLEQLERRLTARTETVNRVNYELTRTLERQQQQQCLNYALTSALDNSELLALIIDRHYRISLCSQAFLNFTGLQLSDIQHKPVKQLEKHLCLPEMASEGFRFNDQGWLNTKLKCRDRRNGMQVFNARIRLTWTAQNEIAHYVIVMDDNKKTASA